MLAYPSCLADTVCIVTSSGSFQTIYPSPSNASTNSYNSLHRRWMRSESMSLERCRESRDPASSVEVCVDLNLVCALQHAQLEAMFSFCCLASTLTFCDPLTCWLRWMMMVMMVVSCLYLLHFFESFVLMVFC